MFAHSYWSRCNFLKGRLIVLLLTLFVLQGLFLILPGWHFFFDGSAGELFQFNFNTTSHNQGYLKNLTPSIENVRTNQSNVKIMESGQFFPNFSVQKFTPGRQTKQLIVKNVQKITPIQLPSARQPFIVGFSPKFIINNEKTCTSKVDIVACIHSHPKHSRLRNIIRQTWSNQTNWPFHRIKTLFFVGVSKDYLSNNETVQHALSVESDLYKDIILIDYIESYRNLTLKALSALHWLRTFCANSTYYLKVDDDIIVNPFSLQKNHMTLGKNPIGDRQIACMVLSNYDVMRRGKWSVTQKEMPAKRYPTYCSGMGFLMLTSTAIALYDVAPLEPLFWIDDVYVTGLLAQRIKATFRFTNATWNGQNSLAAFTGTDWRQFYFGHAKTAAIIEKAWSHMLLAESTNDTILSN